MGASRRWCGPSRAACVCAATFAVGLALPARAAEEAKGGGDLAKAAQNPVAAMVSVPVQNNTLFGIGIDDQVANVTNIQPVIPIGVGPVNVISRIILPLIYVPQLTGGLADLPQGLDRGSTFGLGDLNYTAFFSPAKPGALTWGLGPTVTFPTATSGALGTGKYSLGPSVVLLTMPGHWVIGVLVRQIWSIAGDAARRDVSQFLLQYFVNLNLPKGWYLTTSPIVTASWKNAPGQQWNVPFGAGFGRVMHLSKKVGLNVQVQGFYYVEHPTFGPSWSGRFAFAFLFPSGG